MSDLIPDVSVKHLNAIVSLARYGSFVAAASYLGISQPGLSRIIRQAEDILGADLFDRGGVSSFLLLKACWVNLPIRSRNCVQGIVWRLRRLSSPR